jgi:solute carrier family 25 citrate transporter 1
MGVGGGDGKKPANPVIHLLSGGLTGCIESLCTYPTEFLKTKMQLYKEFSHQGLIGTAKHTYAENGFKGFYRGVSVLVFFSTPKTGIRFYSKNYYDNEVLQNFETFKKSRRLTNSISGLMAGITEAILVVTPMETIKTKLIHDKIAGSNKYRGLFHGISEIVKEKGLGGIYKGLGPTVLRQGSNQAIRFLVYDDTYNALNKSLNKTVAMFIAGGVAGAASVLGNNPIDVIKTQMQGLDAHKFNGPLDCAAKVWQSEGIRGFYKGAVPRMTRVVLDVALTFTLFEHLKNGMDYLLASNKPVDSLPK